MRESSDDNRPVFLSLGMGIESVCLAVRWILEPQTRNFPLHRLTAASAMTGDEFPDTETLMNTHLLPMFAAANIRYIQLSRRGQAKSSGYQILSDSRATKAMTMKGPWSLGQELLTTGTVPQVAARRCSHRSKAEILDALCADLYPGIPFRHAMGFNVDEQRRIVRDKLYATALRDPFYPLNEASWTRDQCAQYLENTFGEPWKKSACSYCPYASNKGNLESLVARWAAHPASAIQALFLEFVALSLNSNSRLFGEHAALDLARERPELSSVLADAVRQIHTVPWALYSVRRVYTARGGALEAKGNAWRSVLPVRTGSRAAMLVALARAAGEAGCAVQADRWDISRVYLRVKDAQYPTAEEFLVAAPAVVAAKERVGFADLWNKTVLFPQSALI